MTNGSPEDDDWLRQLVKRSALLPEERLRQHWQRVIPHLPIAARYELAAILLDTDQCS